MSCRRLEHPRIHLSFQFAVLAIGRAPRRGAPGTAWRLAQGIGCAPCAGANGRKACAEHPTPHLHACSARRRTPPNGVPQGQARARSLSKTLLSQWTADILLALPLALKRDRRRTWLKRPHGGCPFQLRHDGEDYGEFPAVRSCVWCSTAR